MGEQPYIHWFPGQQSTNIIYTMPLCFMSDCENIYAYIKPEIFYLLNIQQDKPNENIKLNDISYADLNDLVFFPSDEEPSMKLQGVPYTVDGKTYYIYLLYIMAQSETCNECISSLQLIENYEEPVYNIFKVGADFYGTNENLNILLSNFGVNLPTSIQKCFWDSNIYEENPDNIILNRKFKELLSNYWDIIANKGSYKSLINSLKWFEWGDDLKVNDIWVKQDFDKIRYEEKPLINFLSDKYKSTINGFAKTTFISLNYALRKVTGKYDEYNPVLEDVVSKWSKQDLMLKLSLLHRFYETYFLPVHEQIFHATVDDIVFGDVINLINHSDNHKGAFLHDVKDFDIVVNNNEPIYVSNVSVGVDKSTLFGNPYIGETNYEHIYNGNDVVLYGESNVVQPKHTIVGVKPINEINEVNAKDFYLQSYNGLGAIVPISCKLDLGTSYDFVYSEAININLGPDTISYGYDEPTYTWDEESIVVYDNKIFKPTLQNGRYVVDIDFNILCKTHSMDEVRCQLMFKTTSGQTFIKTAMFDVFSDASVNLHLYRVNHIDNIESLYDGENIPKIPTNYLLKNIKNEEIETELKSGEESNMLYKMYLPSRNIAEIKYVGDGNPFIVAYGSDIEMNDIVQTDQFEFTHENNKYIITDKRYKNENNDDYSYLVKLFIPVNSKELLKNLIYKIKYNIYGVNTSEYLDTSCHICDKNDFNVYSDKITTGYVTENSDKEAEMVVNADIYGDAYLCISLSTFSSWEKIEIDSLDMSCLNMSGVALNNLLIIKNWELKEDISELKSHYITSEKITKDKYATVSIDGIDYELGIESDGVVNWTELITGNYLNGSVYVNINSNGNGISIENMVGRQIEKCILKIKYKQPSNTTKLSFNLYESYDGAGNPSYYNIKLNDDPNPIIGTNSSELMWGKNFSIENPPADTNTIYIHIDGVFQYFTFKHLKCRCLKTYDICVSKEFWYDPTELIKDIPKKAIYRNDMVFFPEYHKLVPFGKTKTVDEEGNVKYVRSEHEEDYMLRNNDVLAVIPKIHCNGKPVDFKWSNELDHEKTTWEFENLVTGKIYKYNYIQQPYVLGDEGELEKGYYNITFNYKLTDLENTYQVKTGSAFIKK